MKTFAVFTLLLAISSGTALMLDWVIRIPFPLSVRNSVSFVWFLNAPEYILLGIFLSLPLMRALFRFIRQHYSDGA